MKRLVVLITMLLMFISLAACGNTVGPYLKMEEREAIAAALFNSLTIEGSEFESDRYVRIGIHNTTHHDLENVTIKLSGFNNVLLPTLPQQVAAESILYTSTTAKDTIPGSEINVEISYTIGAYTYDTDLRTLKFQRMRAPELILKTDEGELHIQPGGMEELDDSITIQGLSRIKVYSISYNPLITYNGRFTFYISIAVESDSKSFNSIYYKIGDDEGNLIKTDSLYVYSDTISIFVNEVNVSEADGQFLPLHLTFCE